jgi:preprotein translocase subunit SecD
VPTFVRPAPSWWPWKKPVRLGLDLQGGTHLLYGVDIEQAIDRAVERNQGTSSASCATRRSAPRASRRSGARFDPAREQRSVGATSRIW